MSEIELKNAEITGTHLGYEDHGIFTFMLNLKYGGSGQGAGGWALDSYDKKLDKRIGTKLGMDLIIEILKVLEVEKWEDLPGQFIRVKADYTKVHAIGHLLKDKWFDFQKFLKKLNIPME